MDDINSVALVGLGGYGHIYVNTLLALPPNSNISFAAAIDPAPESCQRLAELKAKNIPIFPSLEKFFATTRADLVVLSTPLQLHCEQSCYALARASHVLCEKPLGAHPDQVRQMIEFRDRSHRQLAIGYQWSFSPAIQNLKRDIASGRFGRPRRLRTRVYWPRDEKYYSRNSWAGRQYDSQHRPIFDSPANNACAHYLHNMFYVLGESPQLSDSPATVQAELYRANAIENYDTIALRCLTRRGTEILFYSSHATQTQQDPTFLYEFENASIYYGGTLGDRIIAHPTTGEPHDYGPTTSADHAQKLFDCIASIRAGQSVLCGPEAAGAQTACIFAAQQSTPSITNFPRDLIVVTGNPGHRQTHVQNLDRDLDRCYAQAALPSDLAIPWASPSKKIDLTPLG